MYDIKRSDNSILVTMAANPASIDRADQDLTAELESALTDEELFEVRLLIRESLLNAVVHGSACDPNRHVSILVDWSDGDLQFTVRDDGPGFATPASPASPPADSERGRGLPILMTYSDEAVYDEGGRVLRLRKRVGRVPAPRVSGVNP